MFIRYGVVNAKPELVLRGDVRNAVVGSRRIDVIEAALGGILRRKTEHWNIGQIPTDETLQGCSQIP